MYKRQVIYQPVYEVAGLEGAVYEVRAAEDISTPDGTLRYSKAVSYTHLDVYKRQTEYTGR